MLLRRTSLIALALAVVGALVITPRLLTARQAPGEPSPALGALLPPDAELTAVRSADLTGDGNQEWLLLYTRSNADAPAIQDAALAIAVSAGGGWKLAARFTIEDALVPLLNVESVGERPAVFFSAGVGAHSARLIVVRWDGRAFAPIFDGGSDTPILTVADLDGDTAPEIEQRATADCGVYAVGPRLLTVYRWDGTVYSDATARFPDLLRDAAAENAAILDAVPDLDPALAACVHAAVAYLSALAGDSETAANACATADALDPRWREQWSVPVCP
jgi:hypothetical protein